MATYTAQQLKDAVKISTSYRQVLILLNLSPKGGNNQTLKRKIAESNIDISHFTGQAHSKGKQLQPRRSTETYLNNEQPVGSYRLKNRLIREHILKPICTWCNLSKWLDEDIPLELDHIDGDSNNNILSNLRLLCPNCHALTPTYRGKNQSRAKIKVT